MGGSNHYSKHHSDFNRCHSLCPLCGGRPLVGGSFIGGSTVLLVLTKDLFIDLG